MATAASFVKAFTEPEPELAGWSAGVPPEGMTMTENGALAHLNTGVKCLDFYTKVMARDKHTAMRDATIEQYMADAWDECPLLALRLVANLRDVRGATGKGERHAATVCWKWLLKNHPNQVKVNMVHIPYFGRWKDLLDICLGTELETEMLQLYADQLVCDRNEYLKGFHSDDPVERSRHYSAVSLAPKWAPTEGCAYDKAAKKDNRPNPSFQLATILHDMTSDAPDVSGTGMLRWYRQTYLAPLRKVNGIVESMLCQQKFDEIDFSKVPGVALKLYSKNAFTSMKRPELAERFAEWQKDVLNGKTRMNSNTVDPYEVVDLIYRDKASLSQMPTLEAFYKTQVEALRSKLADEDVPSSVFVIDVSASMNGTPMAVALSLAIWGSAIANAAWRDLFFTFDSNPSIVSMADCTSLKSRIYKALSASVGGSTNLQATLDLILSTARDKGLTPEQMPSRLVIVSDMQFNEATSDSEQLFTNLEVMRAKFRAAGYDMPIVVFWNVRGNTGRTTGAPATVDDKGVIMLSGFSKSLLTFVMEGDDIPTPYEIMLKALSDERYDRLTVVED